MLDVVLINWSSIFNYKIEFVWPQIRPRCDKRGDEDFVLFFYIGKIICVYLVKGIMYLFFIL